MGDNEDVKDIVDNPGSTDNDGSDAGDKGGNSEGADTEGSDADDENGGGSKNKGDSSNGEDGDSKPADPIVRKTIKDFEKYNHIVGRKARQLERERNKSKDGESDDDDEDVNGEPGDDDDIESKVDAAVAKKLSPHFDSLQAQQDEKEVDAYIDSNPLFKNFRARALEIMKHPSRQQIPVDTIMVEAAGGVKAVMKLGAKRNQEADEEALADGGSSGNQPGEANSKKGVWQLPKDEFKAEQDRVRRQI